jgi:hypothetical protein
MSKNMSSATILKTIAHLADPEVNSEIYFASTVTVAKGIIQSLPGVRRLRNAGPLAEQALLALALQPQTRQNENLMAISLHILGAYPSKKLKLAFAGPISERRFTGLNSFLAAETFLKAVGIEAARKDVIAVAMREAKKIVAKNRVSQKPIPRSARVGKKPSTKKNEGSAA